MNCQRTNKRISARTRFNVVMLLSCVMLLAASNGACGQQIDAASQNKPVLQIPLKLILQTVIVPVRVNEREVVNCILDTGMPEGLFLMRPETGKQCKLSYVGPVNVSGAGPDAKTAKMAMGIELGVGDLEFKNERVIVLDEAGPLAHIGVDGAIGASIFNRYIVELDFDKKTLSLFSPDDFEVGRAGSIVALEIDNTKAFVNGHVEIPIRESGRRSRSCWTPVPARHFL